MEKILNRRNELLDKLRNMVSRKTMVDYYPFNRRVDLENIEDVEKHIKTLEIEIARIYKYGKPVKSCFCRLFSNRCQGECITYGTCGGHGLFDHITMYEKDSKFTFFSEPYKPYLHNEVANIPEDWNDSIEYLSRLFGLKVTLDFENSSWNPGSCMSIIFQQGDGRIDHKNCKKCINNNFECSIFGVNVINGSHIYKWCTEYKLKQEN